MNACLQLVLVMSLGQDDLWKSDWNEALKEAKASKKLTLLLFFNKGVKDCARFEKETLASDKVISLYKQYVCVKIDPEGSDADNKLWQDHKSPNPPVTLIFDPEGKLLTSVYALKTSIYAELLATIAPTFSNTIQPCREALASNPDQPDKLASLGEAYAVIQNSAESAHAFERAVTVFMNKNRKSEALKALAAQLDIFYKAKWYPEARACCKQIAEIDSDNESKQRPFAAWVLGMADCSERKWDDAIGGLKDACAKYKDCDILDKMMFTLGSAYMYAKRTDDAVTTFEAIMQKFPGSESARLAEVQVNKLKRK